MVVTLLMALAALTSGTDAQPAVSQWVQEELARIDIIATCNQAGTLCTATVQTPAGRQTELRVIVDPQSAMVRIELPTLLLLQTDTPPYALLAAVATRNDELAAARIVWRKQERMLALVAHVHTDTNFDRKAFRSVVRALLQTADAVTPALRALAQGRP